MRLLGTAQFVGVAVLMGVLLLAEYLGMPFRVLSQDPAFIHDSSAAVGFLSNLGVVAWTMGAGIALFASALLAFSGSNEPYKGLLAAVGGLTALMMFDDLYMVHERLVPRLTGSEAPVMSAFYGVASIGIGLHWRHLFARGGWVLGLAAIFWLGASAVVDSNRVPVPLGWKLFLEDGAKSLGIVTWTACVVWLAAEAIRPRVGVAASREA